MGENSTKGVFQDALNNKKVAKRAWWQWSWDHERPFSKSSHNNFQKARKVNGDKDAVLTRKQKDHQNKVCHKDWDQSFCPGRPKQPRFP